MATAMGISLSVRRNLSMVAGTMRTYATLPSNAYTDPANLHDSATANSPEDISYDHRKIIERALRVDHAGEVAANWIYKGQLAILGNDRKVGLIIQEMWDQEKKHLAVMDRLQAQHRVRPTVLTDVAKVVGFGVGAVTALMGKEAAMACTEAVETVIGEHYDDQLKELEVLPPHPSLTLLKDIVSEFKDDELEHLDTAVEHFSQRAPAHALLSTIVGGGCLVAIELCKRI